MQNAEAHSKIKIGSERSFGIVFCVVFALIALWPLLSGGNVRVWAAVVSVVAIALAFLHPKSLAPLNYAWARFGILLGAIIAPIVMGVVFFLVVTPIGLFLRLVGKDLLRLKKNESLESYWIKRDDAQEQSMKNQF